MSHPSFSTWRQLVAYSKALRSTEKQLKKAHCAINVFQSNEPFLQPQAYQFDDTGQHLMHSLCKNINAACSWGVPKPTLHSLTSSESWFIMHKKESLLLSSI
jgi:hypothetical protein